MQIIYAEDIVNVEIFIERAPLSVYVVRKA